MDHFITLVSRAFFLALSRLLSQLPLFRCNRISLPPDIITPLDGGNNILGHYNPLPMGGNYVLGYYYPLPMEGNNVLEYYYPPVCGG